MSTLDDKIIAITGGSRGIGAAAAKLLAARGATVFICGRSESQIDGVADESSNIDGAVVDIRDEGAVDQWLESIEDSEGHLDVLINNASILGPKKALDETDVDAWRKTMDINVTGTFVVIRRAYRLLRAADRPVMINLSSSVGRKGRGGWGAYSVSKFAVEGMSEVAADELADDAGCVITLNPGGTATKMRAEAYPDEDPETLPGPDEVAQTIGHLVETLSPEHNGEKYSSRELFDEI